MISETDCKTLTHPQENIVHETGAIQERKQDGNSLAQHSKGRTYGILRYNLQ